MNTNKYNTIVGNLALIVLALFMHTCVEEVNYPCDDSADLTFTINGSFIAQCGNTQVTEPASNAFVVVTHFNIKTQKTDTLLQSTLDSQGSIDLIVPNSGCGISNLKVTGSYKSIMWQDSIGFACCDTTLNMQFTQDCDEALEQQLTCNNLDQNFTINLANRYKNCIIEGSPDSEIKWNSISFVAETDIQLDVSKLKNLAGKFSATFTPNPAGNTLQLASGQEFTATFLVETDETGTFSEKINIPVTCTSNQGSGIIAIDINAEICDDGCLCPFNTNGNTEFNVDKSSDGVIVGTTTSHNNESIFTIDGNMLADGCTMRITDIQRYPTNSNPATSIFASHESVFDWTLTSPTAYPVELDMNDEFRLSSEFSPSRSGLSVDTFEVFTEVYNSVGALKDQCSFQVIMTGRGCVNVCPVVKINSFAPSELLSSTNTFIRKINLGEQIAMDSGDKIKQKMTGSLGSLCAGMGALPEKVAYGFKLDLAPDEEVCSNINITFNVLQDGTIDDRTFFELSPNTISLSNIGSESVIATFSPPTISTHLQSGHASTYRVRILAEASTSNGVVLCTQEIKLDAEVNETSLQVSEPRLMKAFSQISDKDNSPAYQAYDIVTYNQQFNYYGKVDNLNPVLGHINTSSVPMQPNSGHAFFFDVDEPTNKTLRQMPKLYLVNNNWNIYKQITKYPVAYYPRNDDFKNDMKNLVQRVFTPGNFSSYNTSPIHTFNFSALSSGPMWSNSTHASEMNAYGTGIPLEVGGVYIIWAPEDNPASSINVGADTYTSYCNVAFLYIDAISDGSGTNHHIGNVSFYVVYPLSIVKN